MGSNLVLLGRKRGTWPRWRTCAWRLRSSAVAETRYFITWSTTAPQRQPNSLQRTGDCVAIRVHHLADSALNVLWSRRIQPALIIAEDVSTRVIRVISSASLLEVVFLHWPLSLNLQIDKIRRRIEDMQTQYTNRGNFNVVSSDPALLSRTAKFQLVRQVLQVCTSHKRVWTNMNTVLTCPP